VIEGSIPLASLQALGMRPVMPGRRWRMGLFRADLGLQGSDSVHWITWIVPHTDKPDFHTPSAFGELQFGQARPLRP
jgi:hypothetical protein